MDDYYFDCFYEIYEYLLSLESKDCKIVSLDKLLFMFSFYHRKAKEFCKIDC